MTARKQLLLAKQHSLHAEIAYASYDRLLQAHCMLAPRLAVVPASGAVQGWQLLHAIMLHNQIAISQDLLGQLYALK